MNRIKQRNFIMKIAIVFILITQSILFVYPAKASTSGVQVSDAGSTGNTIKQGNTSRKLAISADGTIFATYHGSNGIRVARSLDNGQTFEPSVQVNNQDFEAEIAVSSTGAVYVAWVENGIAKLVRSDDGGSTFSATKDVGAILSLSVHMATDGDYLYLIGPSGNTLYRSSNRGDSFETNRFTGASYAFADVHVDPQSKNVVVVADNPTVYYYISSDHGQTFNPVVNTNNMVMYSVGTLASSANGDSNLFVSGQGMNTLKTNLTTGISQTLQFPNNSSSQGRSISGDGFGNIITGFSNGSKVYYAVSTDLGNTFGPQKEVAETDIANIAVNSTNGDVLFLYQQNGAIYLSTYPGELIGYELGLTTSALSFNQAGQKKTVIVTNRTNSPIGITGITTTGEFSSSSNYSGSLNAGDSFEIEVTFNPTTTEVKNGSIEIVTDVNSNKRVIQLTGTGTSAPSLSNEATISNLTIDKGILAPVYDKGTTNYTAVVTNETESVNVTAELTDINATMQINTANVANNTSYNVPLNVGDNPINVVVTAQDGSINTYTIIVARESVIPTYKVTYSGNNSTGGAVPIDNNNYSTGDTATVKGNEGDLVKEGHTFVGWNTKANGSGFSYAAGTNLVLENSGVTLFAMWEINFVPMPEYIPTPNPEPTPLTEWLTVDIVDDTNTNELLVQIPIVRKTEMDGTVKDQVVFTAEKAIESAKRLANQKAKTARIVIPDLKDLVSETNVSIPYEAIQVLNQNSTSLSISTRNGTISIPSSSLASFTDNLFFRIVPVKSEVEKSAITTRAKKEEKVKEILKLENAGVEVLGRPMTIETNLQSRPVTLTFPLPTNVTEEQLNNLAVFIEHSSGVKEVRRGRIVIYSTGSKGIEFDVDHFSTFTILYIDGANAYYNNDENVSVEVEIESTLQKHLAYIHGFEDSTFRPNAYITRQQMAAMLARQLTGNNIPKVNEHTYSDIDKAWAKDEIEFVGSVGIMTGSAADTFAPNNNITRAQMATIAIRWIDKLCAENPEEAQYCKPKSEAITFSDVSSEFWAANEIARISKTGLMIGREDGTFHPQDKLTRAQAVKVLNRLFNRGPMIETIEERFQDVSAQHWAYNEIQEAAIEHSYNLVDGLEKIQK